MPEYATMSTGVKKGQGIGAGWMRSHHEDVFPSDELVVPGLGVVRGVPKYYETIYADIGPENEKTLEQVKAVRRQFAKSHPELFTQGHFNSQYKIYKANMKGREL